MLPVPIWLCFCALCCRTACCTCSFAQSHVFTQLVCSTYPRPVRLTTKSLLAEWLTTTNSTSGITLRGGKRTATSTTSTIPASGLLSPMVSDSEAGKPDKMYSFVFSLFSQTARCVRFLFQHVKWRAKKKCPASANGVVDVPCFQMVRLWQRKDAPLQPAALRVSTAVVFTRPLLKYQIWSLVRSRFCLSPS